MAKTTQKKSGNSRVSMEKTAQKKSGNSRVSMEKTASKQPINIHVFIVIFIALGTVGTMPAIGINYSDMYREVIAETGFIGLLLYWIIRNRHAQSITLTLSAPRLWLSGLLLLATGSVFWAVDIDFFISKYLLWLATAAVFILTLGLSANTKTHISLSRAIVFVGVYISTIGLLQTFFSINLFDQAVPPAANLVNKNMASQIIVLIFPLNLFLLLTDKNKHLSSLYPFAITLMLTYIFHAETRAAWVSMGVEMVLLAIIFPIYKNKLKQAFAKKTLRWNREKTVSTIGAFVLLLLLFNLSADGWSSALDSIKQEGGSIARSAQTSSSNRYVIWHAALSIVENSPLFGSGMGSFYYKGLTEIATLPGNISGVMRVHNDVLELVVELGIMGLIIFLGVVISLLINLFRLIRQDDTRQQLFYLVIAAALAGGFVNMQFSFPYQMPVPLILFGIYSALITRSGDAFASIKTITIPLHSKIRSKIRLVGITFAGLVFISVLTMNTLWLVSFYKINDNIRHHRFWSDPMAINMPICSKLVTKILQLSASLFNENKQYKLALSALNSFNHCAPDNWIYYTLTSDSLKELGHYQRAIEILEKKAIKIHPKGAFVDYTKLYLLYMKTNNFPKALAIYQKLSEKPQELLVKDAWTLHNLVTMSMQTKNPQQAKKFYDLRIKHLGQNAILERSYRSFINQSTSTGENVESQINTIHQQKHLLPKKYRKKYRVKKEISSQN